MDEFDRPIGRKWQNLVHKKCPDCDARFKEEYDLFKCETEDCGFALTREKMALILTDPNHAAIKFMSPHEESILIDALKSVGVDNPEQFIKKKRKSVL